MTLHGPAGSWGETTICPATRRQARLREAMRLFPKNQVLRAFESLDIAGLSHHDPNLLSEKCAQVVIHSLTQASRATREFGHTGPSRVIDKARAIPGSDRLGLVEGVYGRQKIDTLVRYPAEYVTAVEAGQATSSSSVLSLRADQNRTVQTEFAKRFCACSITMAATALSQATTAPMNSSS